MAGEEEGTEAAEGRKEGTFKWGEGPGEWTIMPQRESVFCVLFPQPGPFTDEERGALC